MSIIRGLKEKGLTMVIVTHEMSFARDVSDRVAFLKDGRIIEEDTPDRILLNPQLPETRQFLSRIIESGRL